MTDTHGSSPPSDPLDAVAAATTAWRKAVQAWSEREERDRKIIAAFDSGATGREISAASGLDLDAVYQVHSRADRIRSEAELDRRMAETSRRLEGQGTPATGSRSGSFAKSMARILERIPSDAEVVRGISPVHADRMIEFYEKYRGDYDL